MTYSPRTNHFPTADGVPQEDDGGANVILQDGFGNELVFYSSAQHAIILSGLAQFLKLLKLAPSPIHIWKASGWLLLAGAATHGTTIAEGEVRPVVAVEGANSEPSIFELRPALDLLVDSHFVVDVNARTIRHQQPLIGQGAALIERIKARQASNRSDDGEKGVNAEW